MLILKIRGKNTKKILNAKVFAKDFCSTSLVEQ